MGMRKYQRQVAKARLKAAGVGNVGKKMRLGGMGKSHGAIRRLMRTAKGRRWLAAMRAAMVPNWRRALNPPKKAQGKPRRRIRRVTA